jgi:hypothetical protein
MPEGPELLEVSLAQLALGAAGEMFQAEWTRVIENVMDPNTELKKTREITVKFRVVPGPDRRSALITPNVSAKLVGIEPPTPMAIYLGRVGGQAVAKGVWQQEEAFSEPEHAVGRS